VVVTVAIVVAGAVLPGAMVTEGALQIGRCWSRPLFPATEQTKLTVPLNPVVGVTVMVAEVEPPGAMADGVAVDALRLKAGVMVIVIALEVDAA
jgi:hypothetical protein